MMQQKTVEERLQRIEEYLLEIKFLLKPGVPNQNQISEQEVLMTVKEVAQLVKVDSAVVYAACKRNELPYIRLGKQYKFKKEAVLQWMSAQNGTANNVVDDYVNRYLQKHRLKA